MRACLSRSVLLAALATAPACHEELGIGAPAAEQIRVEALRFEGVEAIDESRLRGVLTTKESPWLPWRETRYFDRDQFEQDLKRVVAFYDDHGYPEAEIVSYDVDLTEGGRAVKLRIIVSEGDPLVVRAVELENFDALPADVRQRLRSALPMQRGEPLQVDQAIASADLAVEALKNHGYPHAEVKLDRRTSNGDVAIVLRAQPGPIAFFGAVDIVGNRSVDDEVIRRQLLYRPGELFRRGDVRESVRQLYGLELFQFATIEVADEAAESGDGQATDSSLVPTRVTVTEGDHRRLEFSLGYGTEERLRAEAEWRHVNFYGGARTLGVHGKWSWLDRGVEGTFVQPYLFTPNMSLSLQAQGWYADEPAFNVLTRGGRATVRHALGRNAHASGTLMYQFQSSGIAREALLDPTLRDELIALGLNPTTGEQDGTLVGVGSSVEWLRTDDHLNPTRGYAVSLNVEQAGGWLPGTYSYLSAIPEVRGYYTPTERVTLAARARFGTIDPFGPPSDVPFFKRFFLGGATSLRGWGRFEVAPLSGFGLPIGGHSLFESSVELRTHVWGNVGVVAFVDAGNVWPDPWQVRFGDLLYDAGPGLRYETPVGPLRLDFAYQLKRLEGLRIDGDLQERPWRIHFSIGHTF